MLLFRLKRVCEPRLHASKNLLEMSLVEILTIDAVRVALALAVFAPVGDAAGGRVNEPQVEGGLPDKGEAEHRLDQARPVAAAAARVLERPEEALLAHFRHGGDRNPTTFASDV